MAEPTLGTVIGPFTIIEALPAGSGGMSLVFVASVSHSAASHSDSLPDKVALKIARVLPQNRIDTPEQAFYFEALNNEVEMLKRLRHPNITRVFPIPRGLPRNPYTTRASELDGGPWICALEYLGGGSLDHRLKTRGALSLDESLEAAYQIGLALDHIHAKGMAHLDLKPDNILFRYPVEEDWRAGPFQPVLIDFGIAAKMSKIAPQAGSLAFMPPERIQIMRGEIAPEQYADQSKADVYGLGVLLYRMLTGHLPFEGLPRDELAEAVLKNRPRSPRELNPAIPAKVDEIILGALEKEADERPRIEEMITRLDEAMVVHPAAPRSIRARVQERIPAPTLLSISAAVSLILMLCFAVSFALGLFVNNSITNVQRPVPTLITTEFVLDTPTPDRRTPTPTLPASPTPLPPTATPTPIS
jgi:serine/threonine protein kinase